MNPLHFIFLSENPVDLTTALAVFTPEDEQIVRTDKSSQMNKLSDVKIRLANCQMSVKQMVDLPVMGVWGGGGGGVELAKRAMFVGNLP